MLYETHVSIHGRQHRVLRSQAGATKQAVVMLHGWMDASDSFRWLAEALGPQFEVLIPDQRGYGGSDWSRERATGYWFHDYLADLDALLDATYPDRRVALIGHSLGGQVAMFYAGLRPERVSHLVSLDGFGLNDELPEKAPEKIKAWLDAVKKGAEFSSYPSLEDVAARLRKNNPRLTEDRAAAVAHAWAHQTPDRNFQMRADPAHKYPFPTTYRLADTSAVWRKIQSPTLWIGAEHSFFRKSLGYGLQAAEHSESFIQRMAQVQTLQFHCVSDASHMLHHERPEVCAALIKAWFQSPAASNGAQTESKQ